jgi:hypothetical protein
MTSATWFNCAIAVGAMIGLKRERSQGEDSTRRLAVIWTLFQ